MEQIRINNYIFDKPLTSNNSGFSKWGIGQRGGRTFFVKEFLSPTFPAETSVYTEQRKLERMELCNQFVQKKVKLYQAIRKASDGNLVIPEQFFRVGAKFYMSTQAIMAPKMSVEQIADRSFLDRLRLCCIIAHAIAGLHGQRIIHADIKPDNILVINCGVPHARIIDFDCSFFEEDPPKLGDELNGDMVYLSPEGFLHIAGIESKLSCKMDVFALGLIFHQYLTGVLPRFDTGEYQYAYESVLDGHPLDTGLIRNDICAKLISEMVQKDPDARPESSQVFEILDQLLLNLLRRTPVTPPDSGAAAEASAEADDAKDEETVVPEKAPVNERPSDESPLFFHAGDL